MHSSKPRRILIAMALTGAAHAGHLGTIGITYPILEPDMLEWIEARVRAKVDSGELQKEQQEQAARVEQKLKNPTPLTIVSKAVANHTFYYDPTFTVNESVLDDKGAIIVPAGTTINPLARVGLSKALIFFDARDRNQVAFAKKFIDRKSGLVKPILVGGSYFDLMKTWQTPVYFDQQGSLVRKLSIKHVPAIVQQEGNRLRIDEIAL